MITPRNPVSFKVKAAHVAWARSVLLKLSVTHLLSQSMWESAPILHVLVFPVKGNVGMGCGVGGVGGYKGLPQETNAIY